MEKSIIIIVGGCQVRMVFKEEHLDYFLDENGALWELQSEMCEEILAEGENSTQGMIFDDMIFEDFDGVDISSNVMMTICIIKVRTIMEVFGTPKQMVGSFPHLNVIS